jgi:hypothetical protein
MKCAIFKMRAVHSQAMEHRLHDTPYPPGNSHSRHAAVFAIAVLVFTTCFLAMPAAAHPPSDMSLSYNELSKELRVTITHTVPNPGEHYVKEVTVSINGKVVNDSRYTSQPAPDTFTYTYPVETGTTDEIKVTATCSLAGSLSRILYNTGPVAPAPSSSPGSQPPQKAAAGLAPLLGAAAVLLIRKK